MMQIFQKLSPDSVAHATYISLIVVLASIMKSYKNRLKIAI